MTATSRVDDLRKRYHENPRRFFAPLANEYRKTGFVDRAILLCEKHLGEQPGNMNGLVVYGQCLFETGRLDEARHPFEAALGVDPENLIALRYLGDIARVGGDQATARTWYEKLLEVDRRNDEVIALLAEVGGGPDKAPPATSQAPNIVSVAGSVRVTNAMDTIGMVDLEPPAADQPPAAPPVAMPAAMPAAPTPPAAATPVAPMRAVPLTPLRAQPAVDPSAKTVEVSAQPKPAKRASLLDVSFDFGELSAEAEAPKAAPEALLPSEAAEYGFAAPAPDTTAEDALDALDSLVEELPSSPMPSDALPMASLIEGSPEGQSLSEMPPIEGLQMAEFSAEVSPLAGLESDEFHGGDAETLPELEAGEFQPPDRPSAALEGLESVEFTPMSLESAVDPLPIGEIALPDEDAVIPPTAEMPAAAEPEWPEGLEDIDAPVAGDEPSRPDPRASVAGLPLLEPFGLPTPRATPTVSDLPLLPSLEEAETVPMNLEALRAEMRTPVTFVTETMAQVYVQQGHTDKAIEVYRQLIAQSPDDAGLRARLRALEAPAVTPTLTPAVTPAVTPIVASLAVSPPPPPPLEEPGLRADGFEPIDEAVPVAAEMPEPGSVPPTFDAAPPARPSLGFDTPLTTDLVDEPAPANAMLSATSFDGISLSTPATPARGSAPVLPRTSVEAPASGPSAREFFARFAHRAATPSFTPAVSGSPAIGGQLMSPLDELFGGDVSAEDEAAAHRLAGIGATSGPSGGSALDSLFGEGPSAPMPSSTPSRGTVPRASEKLKFDQFFASSTPVEGSAATAPAPAPAPAPEPDEPEPVDDEPGEDDDLDQFQGWLRGLTS